MIFFFRPLAAFSVLLVLCGGVNNVLINIVTIIIGDNPIYGYYAQNPAYDVAFVHLAEKYPLMMRNTKRFLIYKPGLFICNDAAAMMYSVAGDVDKLLRELTGFTVLVSPGCSFEIIALGDFAREWGIPLMATIAGDQSLINKKRYPTVIAYGPPDHPSLAAAGKILLEKFSWKTVTFLCDRLSQWPGLNGFYQVACRNFQQVLTSGEGRFTVYLSSFDSTPDAEKQENFSQILFSASKQSRVIFLFTRPSVMREILIIANKLSMTEGDFMFIAPEVTKVPTLGNITWQYYDDDDNVAFRAFHSLIILNNVNPEWDKVAYLVNEIDNRSKNIYNHTLDSDEKLNDLSIAAYEVLTTLAEVLNESFVQLEGMSGETFSRMFFNRTFQMDTRSFFINSFGMRTSDVIFSMINDSTGFSEPLWRFDSFKRSFIQTTKLAISWYGGQGPPLDVPVCGFRNERCFENEIMAGSIATVVLCLFLFLAVSSLIVGFRRYTNRKDQYFLWWIVNINELKQDEEISRLPNTVGRQDDAEADFLWPDQTNFLLRKYRENTVWVQAAGQPLTPLEIFSCHNARLLLAGLRNISHDNIGKFYGIAFFGIEFQLIWEFGPRGTLRMLLDTHVFSLEVSLQISLIWDILRAMQYLHVSALNFHGSPSSLMAVIDKRFTIKLCGAGATSLFAATLGENLPDCDDPTQLWLSPEMVSDLRHPGSKESDLYSLAIVIFEVLTLQSPMDVNLESSSSTSECLKRLRATPTAHRVHIDVCSSIPKILRIPLIECFSTDPKCRPSLRRIVHATEDVFPPVNILISILERLEQYSVDLEIMVYNRTQELIEEARNNDYLLRELIPGPIVTRLRNKEAIQPELFDSVTIFFSDFPQFKVASFNYQPMELVHMLMKIYALFDPVISQYDVYKMETIADSYMVVSGAPVRNEERHAAEIARLSLQLVEMSRQISSNIDGEPMALRVGIHSGSCVAGIAGVRLPRYCLFGDTVNITIWMNSHGEAGKIHLSEPTVELLRRSSFYGRFNLEYRGMVDLKERETLPSYWLLNSVA